MQVALCGRAGGQGRTAGRAGRAGGRESAGGRRGHMAAAGRRWGRHGGGADLGRIWAEVDQTLAAFGQQRRNSDKVWSLRAQDDQESAHFGQQLANFGKASSKLGQDVVNAGPKRRKLAIKVWPVRAEVDDLFATSDEE